MRVRYTQGVTVYPDHNFFISLTDECYRCGYVVADRYTMLEDYYPRALNTREESISALCFLVGTAVLPLRAIRTYSDSGYTRMLEAKGVALPFTTGRPPSVSYVEPTESVALLVVGDIILAVLHQPAGGLMATTTHIGTLQTDNNTGDYIYQVYMALIVSNILPQATTIEAQNELRVEPQLNMENHVIIRNKFELLDYLNMWEDK